MLLDKKLVVAGVGRDCAISLPSILKFLQKLEKIFLEVNYIFVENDSSDTTNEILQTFSHKKNATLITLNGLGSIKQRCKRLEIARNAYIDQIKNTKRLCEADFLLVLDLDDVNEKFNDIDLLVHQFEILLAKKEAAAVFANTTPNYYDLWALRHEEICPDDIFMEVAKKVVAEKKFTHEMLKTTFIGSKVPVRIDPKSEELIEVESAFGGMGIYKMPYIIANPLKYIGTQTVNLSESPDEYAYINAEVCEHVEFNRGVRMQGGVLLINPKFVILEESIGEINLPFITSLYTNLSGLPVFN